MKTKHLIFALVALLIASALYTATHTPQGPPEGYQQPTIKNTYNL